MTPEQLELLVKYIERRIQASVESNDGRYASADISRGKAERFLNELRASVKETYDGNKTI